MCIRDRVENIFGQLTGDRNEMLFWMILISAIGLLICSMGLQKGVELITKIMTVSYTHLDVYKRQPMDSPLMIKMTGVMTFMKMLMIGA